MALKKMCEAKHINPKGSHVFICPNLMTALWRKLLLKAADLDVTVTYGLNLLPVEMHESLTLAFSAYHYKVVHGWSDT